LPDEFPDTDAPAVDDLEVDDITEKQTPQFLPSVQEYRNSPTNSIDTLFC
jgi:hypothetical protein